MTACRRRRRDRPPACDISAWKSSTSHCGSRLPTKKPTSIGAPQPDLLDGKRGWWVGGATSGNLARARVSMVIPQARHRSLGHQRSVSSLRNLFSRMEQRRFFEVRGEESGEWLLLGGKCHPPRVICKCASWNAPKNAALIAAALEAHHSELYSKFSLAGSGPPTEQPAIKPRLESGEAERGTASKRTNRKSRAKHRV